MALWYWLAALLHSSLAWGMDIAAPASTVTTGQLATVSWTIEPQDQLDSYVGILIIPDGDNVDAVVGRLASDKTTKWDQYLVDKNSRSGTLNLMVTQPGVFYFGGYTASGSVGHGGSNVSDHNGNRKRRPKKARQVLPIKELGRSNLVTAVTPGSTAKSPDPSSSSEETQFTSIQTTLSSPDTSTPLGNSISSSSAQEETTTIHSEVNQSHTTVVTLRSGSQTLTLTSDVLYSGTPILSTVTSSENGTTTTETAVISNTVSGSSATPLGVILGSVFGALGFLVVLILILFWLLRRKKAAIQSNWPFKNPQYRDSDPTLFIAAKRFSQQSASDWDGDGTSIAPSDSISRFHDRAPLQRNPVPPSTVPTALTEETENTLITDLRESKLNVKNTQIGPETEGYGFSSSKSDLEEDESDLDTVPPNENIPKLQPLRLLPP
ncbi:hypothetical protein K435DRAFT_518078 [Dendrothele bispora CBS 962.96]|uniref:Mid2 domain-containing protein n=1 Tax=Dendrothele bispora (strain CBS 962.96) TaxID=1314807 RepID=A0A4S8KWF7_DENBC|nr:hypothetical protein K435DRAFT_518078 [Dendrothele bispora CBS 962.96]